MKLSAHLGPQSPGLHPLAYCPPPPPQPILEASVSIIYREGDAEAHDCSKRSDELTTNVTPAGPRSTEVLLHRNLFAGLKLGVLSAGDDGNAGGQEILPELKQSNFPINWERSFTDNFVKF